MIRMEVRGTEQLKAKFGQIRAEMYKGFAAALLAGAFPVSNAAKDKCRKVTGNCARSIHLGDKRGDITQPQPESDGLAMKQMPVIPGAVARVGDTLRKKGTAEVLCGTDVVYAPGLEYVYGFPFLRPALDENRKEVQDETKRAVRMLIKKWSR